MVFAPWAEGRATQVNEDLIVGTFALTENMTGQGWRLDSFAVDEEGIFVTTVFKRDRKED